MMDGLLKQTHHLKEALWLVAGHHATPDSCQDADSLKMAFYQNVFKSVKEILLFLNLSEYLNLKESSRKIASRTVAGGSNWHQLKEKDKQLSWSEIGLKEEIDNTEEVASQRSCFTGLNQQRFGDGEYEQKVLTLANSPETATPSMMTDSMDEKEDMDEEDGDNNSDSCDNSSVTYDLGTIPQNVTKHIQLRNCLEIPVTEFPKDCMGCLTPIQNPVEITEHFNSCGNGIVATLRCPVCLIALKSIINIVEHISKHKIEGILCLTCWGSFSDATSYRDHTASHTEDLVLRCGKCLDQITYPDKETFLEHLDHHHAYYCDDCSLDLHTYPNLHHHLIDKHELDMFKGRRIKAREVRCDICLANYDDEYTLHEDLKSEHHKMTAEAMAKATTCAICQAPCTGWLQYRIHLMMCHNTGKERFPNGSIKHPKLFPCIHCPIISLNACQLNIHMETHFRSDRNKICDVCGKKFKTNTDLRTHISRLHSEKHDVTCELCGRITNNIAIKRHMYEYHREGSGLRTHICPICKADFKERSNLKRHLFKVHDLEYEAIQNLLGITPTRIIGQEKKVSYMKGYEKKRVTHRRLRHRSLRNPEYLAELEKQKARQEASTSQLTVDPSLVSHEPGTLQMYQQQPLAVLTKYPLYDTI